MKPKILRYQVNIRSTYATTQVFTENHPTTTVVRKGWWPFHTEYIEVHDGDGLIFSCERIHFDYLSVATMIPARVVGDPDNAL